MSLNMFTDEWLRREVLARSEIGGGEGYTPADPAVRADAEVVVTTAGELKDATEDHRSGLVYIPGHVDMNLAGYTYSLRGDVTVASDRSLDGSQGARLFTREMGPESHSWRGGGKRGVMHLYDDSTFESLRFIGPTIDYIADENPAIPGYIPFPPQDTYEERKREVYNPTLSRGGIIYGDGVEVANIELAGWANQGFYVGQRNTHAGSPHLHHIDGHDCMKTSAGYVIDVARGHPIIEDSYFNAARHVICGFGYGDGGYTVENCLFGPSHSSHILDMHAIKNNMSGSSDEGSIEWKHRAGGRIEVRRCTFTETNVPPASSGINFGEGSNNPIISIRGVPADHVAIERCHIPHDSPRDAFAQSGVPSSVSTDSNGYAAMSWSDNVYGLTSRTPGCGCEVNLDDPMDGEPLIDAERRESYAGGLGTISGLLDN